jgi:hypothetical protein
VKENDEKKIKKNISFSLSPAHVIGHALITPRPMPSVSNPNPTFPAERLSNLLATMPFKRGELIPSNVARKHHEIFAGTHFKACGKHMPWAGYAPAMPTFADRPIIYNNNLTFQPFLYENTLK